MLLKILIKFNRRRLDRMVANCKDYDKILKQSQKLDVFIAKQFKRIND